MSTGLVFLFGMGMGVIFTFAGLVLATVLESRATDSRYKTKPRPEWFGE